MRLRNRQTKAEFWSDGELLRWHRDKRNAYQGMWHLAEDSGCLEDDPFSIKCTLYPSPMDADITVDVIAAWIEEWIADGKLVRYEVGGKSYLFMCRFHKHQALRTPGAPMLPLPSWVQWVEAHDVQEDGKRRRVAGKYVVERPYESGTNPVRSSCQNNLCMNRKEKKLKEEKEKGKESVRSAHDQPATAAAEHPDPYEDDLPGQPVSASLVNPVLAQLSEIYMNTFGRMLTGTVAEELLIWTQPDGTGFPGFPVDVIQEAFLRAAKADAKKINYVEAILRDWKDRGYYTLVEVLDKDRKGSSNGNGQASDDPAAAERAKTRLQATALGAMAYMRSQLGEGDLTRDQVVQFFDANPYPEAVRDMVLSEMFARGDPL